MNLTYFESISIWSLRHDGWSYCTHCKRIEGNTDAHPNSRDKKFAEIATAELTVANRCDRLERPVKTLDIEVACSTTLFNSASAIPIWCYLIVARFINLRIEIPKARENMHKVNTEH